MGKIHVQDNTGQSTVALNRLEIRYWYKFDGTSQTEQAWIDWAGRLPSGTYIGGVTQAAIVQGSFSAEQDRYLRITFSSGAGSIAANEYAEIKARFNKSDWSNYDQNNDFSYTAFSDFSDWLKVTVYLDGALVWGHEPGWVGPASAVKNAVPADFSPENVYVYPNPGPGRQTIRFAYSGAGDAVVIIYDIAGNKLWRYVLRGASARPGVNAVAWDGQNEKGMQAANGIYFAEVAADGKTIRKKFAVVK